MADSNEPSEEDKALIRKAKKRESSRRYYRKNRDRILKKNKAWIQANKERHATVCKAYRETNKDKERERQRLWRLKNPEKAAEIQKRYRESNRVALQEKRSKNRDKARLASRSHYERNRELYRVRRQQYRADNTEKLSAAGKNYYRRNRGKVLEAHRIYRQSNHEATRKRNREYQQQKWRTDFSYWLKKTVGRRMRDAIGSQSANKKGRTWSLIGCTPQELAEHLESQFLPGMSWENYGYRGWHVDHIIPLAKFDLRDAEQQAAAFHYTNLQPLWAEDNLRKSDKVAGQHLLGFAYAAKIAESVGKASSKRPKRARRHKPD